MHVDNHMKHNKRFCKAVSNNGEKRNIPAKADKIASLIKQRYRVRVGATIDWEHDTIQFLYWEGGNVTSTCLTFDELDRRNVENCVELVRCALFKEV